MKKLLIFVVLLILGSITLFSQDTNEKKKGITAPYFGVFTRTEGVTYTKSEKMSGIFPTSDYNKSTQLIQMLMLDVMLGRRIYFYGQFGVATPLTKGKTKESINLAVGIGVGGYILDKRVDGIGHSWTANLLYVTRGFPALESSVGGEISSFYNYHMSKRLALRVGINVGLQSFASMNSKGLLEGDYWLKDLRLESAFGVNYGLSIGLAF